MKIPLILASACIIYCLFSCQAVTTTTTLPDGTVITQTARKPDQAAIDSAIDVAGLFRSNRYPVTPSK